MKPLMPVIALAVLTAACGSSETGKTADGANMVKVANALCRPTPVRRGTTQGVGDLDRVRAVGGLAGL